MGNERALRADELLAGSPSSPSRHRALTALRPQEWSGPVAFEDPVVLLLSAARVVEALALPIWNHGRPSDVRPSRALEAVRTFVRKGDANSISYCAAASKGCSAARRDSLGSEHRVAEAARSLALAVKQTGQVSDKHIFEALQSVEEALKYEYAIDAIYGRDADIRAAMLGVLYAEQPPE